MTTYAMRVSQLLGLLTGTILLGTTFDSARAEFANDPGAPIAGQPTITLSLPENLPMGGNREEGGPAPLIPSLRSNTMLATPTGAPVTVMPGWLILKEPAGDTEQEPLPIGGTIRDGVSIASDIVRFATLGQNGQPIPNSTSANLATLWSSVTVDNIDNPTGFFTLENPTNAIRFDSLGTAPVIKVIDEAVVPALFTTYDAGIPTRFNRYQIDSVSVPEPASLTLVTLGVLVSLGCAWYRHKWSIAA